MSARVSGKPDTGEHPNPSDATDPMRGLLWTLEELRITTTSLIEAYRCKLAFDPPSSGRLTRWQSRALSALRAARKAQAKTDRSILKLRRRTEPGG